MDDILNECLWLASMARACSMRSVDLLRSSILAGAGFVYSLEHTCLLLAVGRVNNVNERRDSQSSRLGILHQGSDVWK